MALTAVVTDNFYEKLWPVLRQMDDDPKIGPLTLAVLVPSSASRHFRSLIISSVKLDAMRLSEATSLVLSRLRRELPAEPRNIETVSILRTTTPEARILSESFDVSKFGTAYHDLGMAGLAVGLDDAIILLARPMQMAAA